MPTAAIKTAEDTAEMPSPEQLKAALKTLRDVVQPFLEIRWQVGRVGQGKVTGPRPTLADIGGLYVFASDADARVEEIKSYVDSVRDDLLRLDCIREGFVLETGEALKPVVDGATLADATRMLRKAGWRGGDDCDVS
jgi:hypothetical protein